MNTNNTDILIEKYFEGSTSLEEEQRLKEYFSSNEVSDKHKHLKPWFTLLTEERKYSLDDNKFENDFLERIEKEETKKSRIVSLYWVSGIAASLLILFTVFMNKADWGWGEPQTVSDMTENQQMAYAATKNTLMYVSGKLNQGIGKLEYLDEGEKAYENLKALNKLTKTANELQAVSAFQSGIKKVQPAGKVKYMKKYSMY